MSSASSSVTRTFDQLRPARRRLAARDAATVALQVALAEVAAPTGDEGARAEHVAASFRSLGLPPTTDRAGNVVARRPGTDALPPVVVCAHLDTVFDATVSHRMSHERDRIVGPGIGDNARGLAGMLAIADAFENAGVRTRRPVLFVATTGEEGQGNLRGARHVFATDAADAHAAIALDGAGDERVVTHALGIRRYRVRFTGPGGHSWASYGVANALHAAAALASELAGWRLPVSPRTALSVSRMSGGSAINAIPGDAWLEIDVRSTGAAELDRLDREIRSAARRVQERENGRRLAATPPLGMTVELIGDRPGGALPGDAFIAHAAFDATRLVGRTPDAATASTDANIPLSLGIPAIALGAGGRGGGAHTVGEWFENRDGALGLVRAMTVLAALAELA